MRGNLLPTPESRYVESEEDAQRNSSFIFCLSYEANKTQTESNNDMTLVEVFYI